VIILQLSSFSKNNKYSKGVKHMKLKYFSIKTSIQIKEEVQKHRMSIEHISTNVMIDDPLTKGLLPKTFIGHVENVGIMSTSE